MSEQTAAPDVAWVEPTLPPPPTYYQPDANAPIVVDDADGNAEPEGNHA